MSDRPPAGRDSGAGVGLPRIHWRRVDSTNDRARALAGAGAPGGTLVTADEQTAGRGRQGRSWTAPPGRALLMSLVLRDPPALLPLIAGVAVCDAIASLLPASRVALKWPNDVVIDRTSAGGDRSGLGKLGGILAEGRPQDGWAVLGIGVNVALREGDLPVELRPLAASLGLPPSAVATLLEQLLGALGRRLGEPSPDTLAAWRALDALRGREIRWSGGQGRAEGVDADGRLIVALADGERRALDAGEVHLSGDWEDSAASPDGG